MADDLECVFGDDTPDTVDRKVTGSKPGWCLAPRAEQAGPDELQSGWDQFDLVGSESFP